MNGRTNLVSVVSRLWDVASGVGLCAGEARTSAAELLEGLVDLLPSGGGFDAQPVVNLRITGSAAQRAADLETAIELGSVAQILEGYREEGVSPGRLLSWSIRVPYHAHGEHGYAGWYTYRVTVRPGWDGPDIDARGPNTGPAYLCGLRDYVSETYRHALTEGAFSLAFIGGRWRLEDLRFAAAGGAE